MYLKLQQLHIHYSIIGAGQPIILLHGWGNNAQSFHQIRKHLAKHFTVYDIDLPGFGLSTEPAKPWDTKNYTDLIEIFIKKLKIHSPILIGHSLGGRIAIRLTSSYPTTEISQLILIDSAGIRPKHGFTWYRKVYTYKLLKKIALCPIFHWFFGKRIESYKRKAGSNDYRNASGIMRQTLVKIVNEDLRDLLSKITSKTLLIWGENDTATPLSDGELMNREIPNSRLVVIPNAGHHPHHDAFDQVIKEIDRFLSVPRKKHG